jgi:WhiB family redox-sensing transcriptional regulator
VSGWYDLAACKGLGHKMFPERGNAQMAHAAIAICNTCPVTEQCLASALETEERFGVWGGMSEKRRREMRIPSACGSRLAYDRGCRCEDCNAAYTRYNVGRRVKRLAGR